MVASSIHWQEHNEEQIMKHALSGVYENREAALGDLSDHRYKREDRIRILQAILKEAQDWETRVKAAMVLITLDTDAGIEVMKNALQAAAQNGAVSREAAWYAVANLHRYAVEISPNDLLGVVKRYQSQGMLEIAALQGLPAMEAIIREKREAHDSLFQTEILSVYMGLKDPQSIERYTLMLRAEQPELKVLGLWGLYQTEGKSAYLDEIIEITKRSAGIGSWQTDGWMGFRALKTLVTPESTRALEVIVEKTEGSRDTILQYRFALEALYYFHRDYEFVDRKIVNFFTGKPIPPGIDRGAMWRIAAARATPEVERLACSMSPSMFEDHFVLESGDPPQTWIAMQDVPLSVLKALKNQVVRPTDP